MSGKINSLLLGILLCAVLPVSAQQRDFPQWIFGLGGGYNQSLFYCGRPKTDLYTSFTSRDAYVLQLVCAKNLKTFSVDQAFRVGGQLQFKHQDAYFYYEEPFRDTVIPTGMEQRIAVLHLNVYPEWAFGDKVHFVFYAGPNLELVLKDHSNAVRLIGDEKQETEAEFSDEVRGFSVGGTLGIGVEIPVGESLSLYLQNAYTSGYSSKKGHLKEYFNYYNSFDINLMFSILYTISAKKIGKVQK